MGVNDTFLESSISLVLSLFLAMGSLKSSSVNYFDMIDDQRALINHIHHVIHNIGFYVSWNIDGFSSHPAQRSTIASSPPAEP